MTMEAMVINESLCTDAEINRIAMYGYFHELERVDKLLKTRERALGSNREEQGNGWYAKYKNSLCGRFSDKFDYMWCCFHATQHSLRLSKFKRSTN